MSNELQVRENVMVGLTNSSGFELAQRAAKMLSMSSLVPKDYQGPSGMPNCVIALNMASRMGADPLMVMQNLVVVHGKPTWSSQFLIATFNSCGRFSSMRYEFFGDKNSDDYGCRAVSIENSTGEKLIGTDVTIAIAKAEGWYGRNGSKWKTMPQQMLTYRAACWFVRAYAPELSMGLHSAEEVIDIGEYKDVTPRREAGKRVDDLLGDVQESSNVIDIEVKVKKDDPYLIGKTLSLIENTSSLDELSAIDMTALNAKDQKVARTAWLKKKDELQPKAEAQALSIADRINACTSAQELNNLIQEINDETIELENDALIGEKYDSFR